jgi:hypothetical protein
VDRFLKKHLINFFYKIYFLGFCGRLFIGWKIEFFWGVSDCQIWKKKKIKKSPDSKSGSSMQSIV